MSTYSVDTSDYRVMNGGGKNFKFTNSIKEDYNAYLQTLEDFLNTKDAQVVFEITNDSLIKKNAKTKKKIIEIKRPQYFNTEEVLKALELEYNYLHNKIIKTRHIFFLTNDIKLIEKIEALKKEFINIQRNIENIKTYDSMINKKDMKIMRKKVLVGEKNKAKKTMRQLMESIKDQKNADKECKEYVKVNNVLKIEEEIKELEDSNDSIGSIIQMEKPDAYNEVVLPETKDEPETLPEEHPELSDSILGLETLDIKDEDLENMSREPDVEEISYYENKPEILPEDIALPDILPKEKLKKDLLSPKGSKKSKDGKTRRKMNKIPVKEGPCKIPFNYKDKTYEECAPSKLGDWCATTVNEKNEPETLGFCE